MRTWIVFGRHFAALRIEGDDNVYVGKGSCVQEAVNNSFFNYNKNNA